MGRVTIIVADPLDMDWFNKGYVPWFNLTGISVAKTLGIMTTQAISLVKNHRESDEFFISCDEDADYISESIITKNPGTTDQFKEAALETAYLSLDQLSLCLYQTYQNVFEHLDYKSYYYIVDDVHCLKTGSYEIIIHALR